MSGHSKWSTIKRKKGAVDAKRGKIFSKVIKEITIAAKFGGGDPTGNPRLRHALLEAKACNMPRENIERAIKKGTGELEGVMYEELVYEAVGPSGTLVIAEILTDNRNRTAAELRKVFEKAGGQLSASGSATWAFDQVGIIRLDEATATEEQLFEIAVGAGAEDLVNEDGSWIITTPRTELYAVRDALEAAALEMSGSGLEQIPKTPKVLGGSSGQTMINLLEALDDHDDVQNVFSDFQPSDELMAELTS